MRTVKCVTLAGPKLGIGSAGQGRALGDLRAATDVAFKMFHCLDGFSFFIKIVPVDVNRGEKNEFLYSAVFTESTLKHCELFVA